MIKIERENQVNRLKPGDLIYRYPTLGEPEDELALDKGNLDKFKVGKYDPANGIYELIIIDEEAEAAPMHPGRQAQLTHNVPTIEKKWRSLIKESRWWIEGL
jgi:intein/homing endonuclease